MLRRLIKDSSFYAIGILLDRAMRFVMIPIYTRVLTPSDFGVVEIISRLVELIGLLLALGMSAALLRFYNEAKDDGDRRSLVASGMILMTTIAAAAMLLLIPASPLLNRLIFDDTQWVGCVRLAVAGTLLSWFVDIPLTILRAQGKLRTFTTFSCLQLLSAVALKLALVVWLRLGVLGVVLSTFLNAALWGAILGVAVWRSAGLQLKSEWVRRLLAYGLPLVPAMLAQFALHFSDRFFLVRSASSHELGIYALAYRFAMLVPAFSGIMVFAWWPWAFRIAKEPEAETHLRDAAAMLLTTTGVLCSGVILFADPVLRLVAAQPYWVAARYVPPLVLAYWFFDVQTPLSLGAHLAKRTDALAVASTVSAASCLGLSVLLIPRYKAWGAAAVTLASFALLAISTLIGSRLFRPLPQRWGVILGSLACVLVATAAAGSRVAYMPSVGELAMRVGLWVAIILALSSWLIARWFRNSGTRGWVARIAKGI